MQNPAFSILRWMGGCHLNRAIDELRRREKTPGVGNSGTGALLVWSSIGWRPGPPQGETERRGDVTPASAGFSFVARAADAKAPMASTVSLRCDCDGFATLERNNFGGLNETAAPRFWCGTQGTKGKVLLTEGKVTCRDAPSGRGTARSNDFPTNACGRVAHRFRRLCFGPAPRTPGGAHAPIAYRLRRTLRGGQPWGKRNRNVAPY
jgi:hypothetical protein